MLQHMNNPASRCILFLDELVKLSEAVGSSQDNDSERQPESCVVQEDFPMHEPHDYSDTVPLPGQQNSPSDSWFSDAARASADDYFVEAYPNASQVYGRGETLMEIFDADVNAENRRDNLYYPFASRQEWQMASFLLRSSLSMTAVDEFLSLELVGFFLQSQSLKADMLDTGRTIASLFPYSQGATWPRRNTSTWSQVAVYALDNNVSDEGSTQTLPSRFSGLHSVNPS